ncbi:MAG: nonstructural protein [Microviridae sp.]|nr:MAG: nonstructural protein [Microviridae sp.]
MKLLLCSIYDGAVAAYQPLFTSRSKGEASRTFADAVTDTNSPFNKHPGDFTLYAVATFDDKLCLIEPIEPTEKIITALECLSTLN